MMHLIISVYQHNIIKILCKFKVLLKYFVYSIKKKNTNNTFEV